MAPKTRTRPTRATAKLPKKEEAYLNRLRNDMVFYGSEVLKIKTKQGLIQPFDFNRAQIVAQDKIAKQLQETGRVRVIILKSRQKGLSTLTAGRFFRRCHVVANQKASIVADQRDKGSNLFEIYQRFHDNLPEDVYVGIKHTAKGNFLNLLNGSEIVVDTAGDITAGRSATIQLLHLSEVAFWTNAEDVYVSLVQTVPDMGSEIIIESTANGVGNFFHRMWLDAKEGRNGYIAIFLPWWIHEDYSVSIGELERQDILNSEDPIERKALDEGYEWEGETHKLTPEQLAWRRRTIQDKCAGNERVFRQEYPATDREAFLVSGACFFDEDALENYEKGFLDEDGFAFGARPYRIRGTLVRKKNRIDIQRNERGWLRIWHPPHEKYCVECRNTKVKYVNKTPFCPKCGVEMFDGLYVIGADTASGRQVAARDTTLDDPDDEKGGRDFSSADVIEVRTMRQVAHLHYRMAPEVFAEQLNLLGFLYSSPRADRKRHPALLGVERNYSSGETVIRELNRKHNYPNLYSARQMNTRLDGKPTIQFGWMTTKTTRMPMLDELAAFVRSGELNIACEDSIREMYTFVRGDDGKPQAQEGAHDDRVLSLAVALQVARSQPKETKQIPIPQPEYTNSPTGWGDYG